MTPAKRTRVPALGLALGLALALLPGRARAELVEVRQVAGGMECAECAHNLKVEAKRLDGVDGTDASWNRRILTVRFRAGSRTTLEELRAIVRRHHFSVREAEVVVRGRVLRSPSGGFRLAVSGSGAVYEIGAAGDAPAPAGPIAARLESAAAGASEITVRGRIAGDDGTPAGAASRIWILELGATGEVRRPS